MLEGRHHELAHVPLVKRPRAGRELVLQIEVLQPDLNELAERGVAGEFSRGDVARPLREHLLQVALGLLVGGTGGRDAADLAVVVAVSPSAELTVYELCALAVAAAGDSPVAIDISPQADTLRLVLRGTELTRTDIDTVANRAVALGGTLDSMTGSMVLEVPCA